MQTLAEDIKIVFGGTLFLLSLFGFIFLLVINYNRRYRKNEEEKQELIKKFEKETLQSQIEIQEETLSYVSGEIHENVCQILVLANLQLESVEEIDKQEVAAPFKNINRAIEDLRALSKRLNSDNVNAIGIIEAIQNELSELEKSKKYITQFSLESDFTLLARDKTTILYRIIQEVLKNIIKHAKANNVSVVIGENNFEEFIKITDNGIGFNLPDIDSRKGLGLTNIFNRAKLIGGEATITSELNKGTTFIFKIHKK
jgi:two-component system NarL family sensor kinase